MSADRLGFPPAQKCLRGCGDRPKLDLATRQSPNPGFLPPLPADRMAKTQERSYPQANYSPSKRCRKNLRPEFWGRFAGRKTQRGSEPEYFCRPQGGPKGEAKKKQPRPAAGLEREGFGRSKAV